MSDRTKKIAIGLLALLFGLFAVDQLWSKMVVEPNSNAQAKLDRGTKQINKMKLQIKQAKQRIRRLDVWRKRSLPSGVDSARTQYQGWLHTLVGRVGLEQRYVDSGAPSARKGHRILPFTIRGVGTMEQLTELLFEFYKAPHLHRIRTLSISPLGSGERLDLSFAIEAMIVEGCDRVDMLATGVGTQLASDNLVAYRVLAYRNLFGRSQRAGIAELTELTAVVAVDGISEAWFMNRVEDSMQKLRVGDQLHAGWFDGQVAEIDGNDVVLDADGDRWLLTRGDRLVDAVALPPEF